MDRTRAEQEVYNAAIAYARKHKKAVAKRLTNRETFPSEPDPVSVFMAGSPGAGKTEASIELLNKFSDSRVVRIDPDELRGELPHYTGGNAWLFQGAVSILVDRVLDRVFKQKQSFLLDGTLSRYDVASKNVERSIKKGRFVQILYVYQQPLQAWSFVKARESAEGRRIKWHDFVREYFDARKVVNQLKSQFGGAVRLDLLMKNNDNTSRWYRFGVDNVDAHIAEQYTPAQLEELLPKDEDI